MNTRREVSPGAKEAVLELLERIPNMPADERIDFLEMLVCAGVHFMRAGSGDTYVRGFLDGAIKDLDGPPMFTITDLSKN